VDQSVRIRGFEKSYSIRPFNTSFGWPFGSRQLLYENRSNATAIRASSRPVGVKYGKYGKILYAAVYYSIIQYHNSMASRHRPSHTRFPGDFPPQHAPRHPCQPRQHPRPQRLHAHEPIHAIHQYSTCLFFCASLTCAPLTPLTTSTAATHIGAMGGAAAAEPPSVSLSCRSSACLLRQTRWIEQTR